jgi:serine/threonine protein kinase
LGNYQLVKLLGRGGCAEVHLGKHRYLNSYAALKVLNARIQPKDEHRYLAEAQTLVDLQHPNIVHLRDFCIENGTPVLIMDYAPRGSLRQNCLQGTQMSLATVVDFVAQIAAALQYAHNHNVIHRDVKPENVLLSTDNHVLLSDFGLSLLIPSPQQLSTQDPVGTARYMAPEQLRGKPCFASDQYALGIMVYEWLCGGPPFHGTTWEVWHQHTYAAPPPLCPVRPELPLRLEKVILRSLAKRPQDRFVSIQAFARALAQACQTFTPVDENASQVTAPLQVIPGSSSTVHPPPQTAALLPQQNQIVQIPTRAHAKNPPEPLPAPALQNRIRMLRRLRRSYTDLMSQSLQGVAWLELGLAEKPDAVQNMANLVLHVERRPVHHLPPGTSILQAYDEAEHELLILGEPGAGKSTLLLDLAQRLVLRAEQDETHPWPVILPLSSWAVKRGSLEDWIAEQLAQIYNVPHKLCVQWVQEGAILPLLDGFDEMEETVRPACIVAINSYHRDHMAKLVVCSRTTEYGAAASRRRLALQGAVVVQPLTNEDVDAYLARAGQPLAALRDALRKNGALHDLATTPLMLNILILTYQSGSAHDLPKEEAALLQQIWGDYVERMVARKGNSKRYPLERTRAWLSYLARQMRTHNQTVFYLENLQPDWLSAQQQRSYKRLAVRLFAIFIGILVSILVQLFFFGGTALSNLSHFVQYSVLGGFLGGLWRGPTTENGSQREVHRYTWIKRLIQRLAISVCLGLIYGLCFGFLHLRDFGYTLSQRQGAALLYSVIMIVSFLLLQYMLTARSLPGKSTENSAPRLWTRVAHFISAVQGLRGLLVTAVIGLGVWLNDTFRVGPIIGLHSTTLRIGTYIWLIIGLSAGIIYVLIHLVLSIQMEDVRPAERLMWTRKSLKSSLFNSKHLLMTLLVTCITTIFIGLSMVIIYGLSKASIYGLSAGLSLGLSYWCILGLYQGVAQLRIENQDRLIANQGIYHSWRNGVIMGVAGGTIIGIIAILSYWLSNLLSPDLRILSNYGLSYGLLILVICGTLLIYLLTGGLAVLRHFIIRLLLSRSHTFPWRAPQFLDDATARFLLRRVGGGYSFTHRLLLDYFADVETEAVSGANTSSKLASTDTTAAVAVR